jgi:hypothetical protein
MVFATATETPEGVINALIIGVVCLLVLFIVQYRAVKKGSATPTDRTNF